MKILYDKEFAQLNNFLDKYYAQCVDLTTANSRLFLVTAELDQTKEALAKANNTIQELILEAGWNGLKVELKPEVMVPAKVIPEKVIPAHIEVSRLGHFRQK